MTPRRICLALALAGSVVTGSLFTAQASPPVSSVTVTVTEGPLSGGDDLAAALSFEQRMGAISLQQGKAVPVDLDAAGKVVGTGGWGDSGLWTGFVARSTVLVYSGSRVAYDANVETLRALGGRTMFVSDAVGGAAAIDLAFLSFLWGSAAGLLQGAAFCESEHVDCHRNRMGMKL